MRVENPNKLKPVPDDVNTFLDLPEDWAYPKIGEILTVNYGKGLKESVRVPMDVAVYGSNGIVGQHHIALTKGPTIIIGRKGTVGAVHYSNEACWPIDTTYYIDEFNGLEPKYLLYSLRSLSLTELDTSTAIPGLNRNELYDQHLPLSPLPEQKRIVAKLEGLLTRVNTTKERLAKVSMVLKRFRQAVLAAAFSGKLTESWRKRNPHVEPANKLFERIRFAMQKNYRKEEERKFKKYLQKLNTLDYYRPFGNELYTLPETWMWTPLGMIGEIVTGKTPSRQFKDYWGGNIPFIMPQDLSKANDCLQIKVIESTSNYVTLEALESVPHLWKPAVLVCCIGTLGRVAICQKKAAFSQQINAVIPHEDINLEYLGFYCHTIEPILYELWPRNTYMAIVNKTLFSTVPMPLPPKEEQEQIVREIKNLMLRETIMEERSVRGKIFVDKLTQSILAKAFRGELVPTEAELAHREGRSYEPASELLARIKSAMEKKCLKKVINPRG